MAVCFDFFDVVYFIFAAIHCAASKRDGNPEIIILLLDAVPDDVKRVSLLKKANAGGNTALHCAADCKNKHIVKAILSKVSTESAKELISMKNNSNQTVYDIAVQNSCALTIKLLYQRREKKVKPTKCQQANGESYHLNYWSPSIIFSKRGCVLG